MSVNPTNMDWASTVRLHMKTASNPSKRPLTLRDLSKQTGRSYEHVRKAVSGEPVVSREFNDAICVALGLDAKQMWNLMARQKMQRRAKKVGGEMLASADARLAATWPTLLPIQQNVLSHLAEDFAASVREIIDASPRLQRAACFVVTMERSVIVIAGSAREARHRAARQHKGARPVRATRMTDAVSELAEATDPDLALGY